MLGGRLGYGVGSCAKDSLRNFKEGKIVSLTP